MRHLLGEPYTVSYADPAGVLLTGEPVDHVPFGVFGVCWGPWGSTLERWRREAGDQALD